MRTDALLKYAIVDGPQVRCCLELSRVSTEERESLEQAGRLWRFRMRGGFGSSLWIMPARVIDLDTWDGVVWLRLSMPAVLWPIRQNRMAQHRVSIELERLQAELFQVEPESIGEFINERASARRRK